MKKFFEEFKEFISKGNVMDLAVAVVIGAAFTAIVTSVVNDLIMPIVSLVTGGVDFSEMKIVIGTGADPASITYGNLISAIIQFLIIALVVFLIVKALNKAQSMAARNKAVEEKLAPKCPYCLQDVEEGATRCPHCTSELPFSAR